jgi:hypothetical protein
LLKSRGQYASLFGKIIIDSTKFERRSIENKAVVEDKKIDLDEIVTQLHNRKLLIVNPRRRNGLILYKRHYAEFAGPGAIIGGEFDLDVVDVSPVGDLSIIVPETVEAKKQGYLIRRQWIRLTKHITDNPNALQRAQVILNQFEHWFDADTASQMSDRAFSLLVGVLPQTIGQVRSQIDRLE